jgi:nitrous oxidase accessory protein
VTRAVSGPGRLPLNRAGTAGRLRHRLLRERRRLLVLAAVALGGLVVPGATAQERTAVPGAIEGRPDAAAVSPLQARIDAAAPGALVEVAAGTYAGDLVIDKPLRLVGRGRPALVGSGTGSVIRIRADDVTVEGFDIDGRRGGDLGRDSSGVHVAAERAVVRDCRIKESLFGVYLREAHGSVVEGCVIRGIPGRDPGEKGSGIHAYNTHHFRFSGNELVDVRDALYLQNASQGVITGNRARDMRYGLHYMFSDDNVFEDNTFENGDAGTAVMYSERIVFRRNRFLRNRGFASVGLLLQQCVDVLAEDNFIGDNARGIFLEGTRRNMFRRNIVAASDTAIVLYGSATGTRFEGNLFAGNMSPLLLVGRRTDTVFDGNYWSDNRDVDLDGDGFTDRPYRLSNVFDHFRGNLTAADLFSDGFAAMALAAAERAFPIIQPPGAIDARPLARPPVLADVPRPAPPRRRASLAALMLSGLVLAAGLTTIGGGWRTRPRGAGGGP